VDAFWGTLGHLANTVIFFVAGLIVAARAASDPHLLANSLWRAITIWILLHVVRAIMLILLWPVLSNGEYNFTIQQAVAVVYGGLRGAVSLTLALIVNEQLDEQKILLADSNPKLSDNANRLGDELLFYVAIVAFLTLLINGTTMEVSYTYMYINVHICL
jgi:NhaP-type Na+/H+ or K+/H+ antiporter